MRTSSGIGAAFATFTAVVWGGQFVVGKSALAHVDAFWLTTVRYALAAAILLGVLAAVEGVGSLRVPGRRLARLAALGALGFAGFNLLAYTGLEHARPQSASLIVALGPLLTALLLWARDRVRPSRVTFAALAAALADVVPEILYLALPGAVLAVLAWNAAVERIGPQVTTLFGNLIPVTTFAIEIVRGYRPGALELVGAVVTIAALTADNLLRRRSSSAPQQP